MSNNNSSESSGCGNIKEEEEEATTSPNVDVVVVGKMKKPTAATNPSCPPVTSTTATTTASSSSSNCCGRRLVVGFDDLSRDLQEYIVDYIDNHIPTLGALACVSKTLHQITYQDCRWKGHLRLLQKKLYEDNIRIIGGEAQQQDEEEQSPTSKWGKVIPLSQRTLQSTKFLSWCDEQEQRMDRLQAHGKEKVPLIHAMRHSNRIFLEESDAWLYQNVALREYYQQAGGWAIWSEICCQCYCLESNKCYTCFTPLRYGPEGPGAYCRRCGTKTLSNFTNHLFGNILKDMPPIQLFRSLPIWAKPIHKGCLEAQKNNKDGGKQFHAWVQNNYERFG